MSPLRGSQRFILKEYFFLYVPRAYALGFWFVPPLRGFVGQAILPVQNLCECTSGATIRSSSPGHAPHTQLRRVGQARGKTAERAETSSAPTAEKTSDRVMALLFPYVGAELASARPPALSHA